MTLRNQVVSLFVVLAISGCATLPDNIGRSESHAYTDTDNTHLARLLYRERIAHPDQSGLLLLKNGLDAFLARALLAQRAERSIDAQYYLLHDDLTGKLFIDQLLKAAEREVRVRLLVDDMDLAGRDLSAAALDSHPHIEVRIFNPFSRNTGRVLQFVTRLGSVTRRMHNKSFTVDNQATILGGRNIGDEYFDANPDLAFGDLDVLAFGPAAREVSESFDQYWNNELAYPVSVLVKRPPTPEEIEQARQRLHDFVTQQADSAYLQALQDSPLANDLRRDQVRLDWGATKVVSDHAEKLVQKRSKSEFHLAEQLKRYIDHIAKEIIIFSPYFVPGKQGVAFFKQLRERGVRVRVLTNSLASTDVSAVHAGYAKYRKTLLRAGVELYEVNKTISKKQRKEKKGKTGSSKASLHAKSFVFDRQRVFIGSLNLDPRSLYENTEIGVVLTSQKIAKSMAEWFDKNIDQIAFRLELKTDENGYERLLWHGLDNGAQRVFDVEPHSGFWRRFGVGFLRLFPIESQL